MKFNSVPKFTLLNILFMLLYFNTDSDSYSKFSLISVIPILRDKMVLVGNKNFYLHIFKFNNRIPKSNGSYELSPNGLNLMHLTLSLCIIKCSLTAKVLELLTLFISTLTAKVLELLTLFISTLTAKVLELLTLFISTLTAKVLELLTLFISTLTAKVLELLTLFISTLTASAKVLELLTLFISTLAA